MPFSIHFPLIVESPTNETYTSNSISLDFTTGTSPVWLGGSVPWQPIITGSYALDGKLLGQFSGSNVSVSDSLNRLSEGVHRLEVSAAINGGPGYGSNNRVVFFTVDTVPPSFSGRILHNENIDGDNMLLNFTISERITRVDYRIDEERNATLADLNEVSDGYHYTVTGMASLEGLQGGQHNMMLYATDTGGSVGTSPTLQFSTAQTMQTPSPTQTPTSSPYPSPISSPSPLSSPTSEPTAAPKPVELTTYVFAGIIIMVIVGLLVFAYFRKRGEKSDG